MRVNTKKEYNNENYMKYNNECGMNNLWVIFLETDVGVA
jgi:hypothetical protein